MSAEFGRRFATEGSDSIDAVCDTGLFSGPGRESLGRGVMTTQPVQLTLYRWAGQWGPFKVNILAGNAP